MEGRSRKVLVREGIGLPNALTFDTTSRQVCWADAGKRAAKSLVNPPAKYSLDFNLVLCAAISFFSLVNEFEFERVTWRTKSLYDHKNHKL